MAALRELIPSMFHRRLLLLAMVMLVAVAGVGAQLVRLTVVEGDRWLAEAESVLRETDLLPTVRGSIVDRKGRVLARDVACENIAVDYRVITGEWAITQARRQAYREHRNQWATMSANERDALVRKIQPHYDRRLEQLWRELCERGGIEREELERRKTQVIRMVQRVRAAVWARTAEARAAEQGGAVDMDDFAIAVAEERQAHTLLPAVDEATGNYFRRRADDGSGAAGLPGLRVIASTRREYPFDRPIPVAVSFASMPEPLRDERTEPVDVHGLGRHVIGSMRDVWAEDVDADTGGRPFQQPDGSIDLGGYLPGDTRGSRGVEASQEDRLRGLRGRVWLNRRTQQRQVLDPVRGQPVRLTLDIHLQARIQALLDPSVGLMKTQPWHGNEDLPLGMPLNGSAVVLDVDTGDVLALVTSPAVSADEIGDAGAGWPEAAVDQPLVNRPVSAIYPPGSTLKPIIYALAAKAGVISHEQVFTCEGQMPNRSRGFRCWGWRPLQGKFYTHGPLTPHQAIAHSCNIYFYSCGRAFWQRGRADGVARLVEGLRGFGFGQATGIGLDGESPGVLPATDGANAPGRSLNENNAMLLGIGQGPIAVTPLQVAVAHAALARRGEYRSPVIVEHQRTRQQVRDLDLPARVVDQVLQGLHESANASHGTGHHLRYEDGHREPLLTLEGVICRSKTGTAQAPPQFIDVNANGRLDEPEPIVRSGSHSWYVCHVQPQAAERAKYVIAVLVEYGGSGGRVSGPIVNQILHALRGEGYL